MIPRHRVVIAVAAVAFAATAGASRAADPTPPVPAAAAAASYDDPGMHVAAPPGWEKVAFPPADAQASGDDKQTLVAFVYHRGASDQRTIAVTVSHDAGSLDAFDHSRESELRQTGDGTFVHASPRTLANGMPAMWLSTQLGNDVGHYVRRYDELIYDGTRDIDVVYSGREGDFTEAQATADLASLYVVQYPHRRV